MTLPYSESVGEAETRRCEENPPERIGGLLRTAYWGLKTDAWGRTVSVQMSRYAAHTTLPAISYELGVIINLCCRVSARWILNVKYAHSASIPAFISPCTWNRRSWIFSLIIRE